MKRGDPVFAPGPGLEWLGLVTSGVLVRRSGRARSINLRMLTTGELEVILPRGASVQRISDILSDRCDWIERTSEHARRLRALIPPASVEPFPSTIELKATGEVWSVTYEASGREYLQIAPDNRLVVKSAPGDESVIHALLRKWLALRARAYLAARLDELSRATGRPYTRMAIRRQKTRWGSCSQRGVVSLNACLLFLPRHLADYVLIHELSHTLELNHSTRFWSIVARFEPSYREYEKELRIALLRYVPRWAAAR